MGQAYEEAKADALRGAAALGLPTDGNLFAAAGFRDYISVSDVERGQERYRLAGVRGDLASPIVFSTSGNRVAVTSTGATYVWRLD